MADKKDQLPQGHPFLFCNQCPNTKHTGSQIVRSTGSLESLLHCQHALLTAAVLVDHNNYRNPQRMRNLEMLPNK
tara:strand:+ start:159 stop:383 length:225 start_codon:yes stop_codon:yes gene_type:complete